MQRRLVELRKENKIGNVLLLLEHSPVITLGRNADRANVIASPEEIAGRGVEVFECDRGGDVTFHGPGQLVGYPVFDLRGMTSDAGLPKTVGAVEYVRRLEEVLIRTCADFGIATRRIAGLTGVWTSGHGIEAKIAAIGVHISRAVTSHGFALNVNNDLDYFNLIVPCGIHSKPVTSMAKELGREISLSEVANSVARNSGMVFQSQILSVEDLDSLLQPSLGVPMKLPDEFKRMHKEEDTFLA
jgi:lipoyl(octanoyl) transferase